MKLSNVTLITSTGRTGTMFFQKYLTETGEDCICLHEPAPSRIFRPFSNAMVRGDSLNRFPGRIFCSTRKKYLEKHSNYVESSNFLYGCIPSLNAYVDSLKVIHLVRHPLSYARSHLAHGFWRGSKKLLNRFFPLWLEPVDEKNEDPVRILLLRWKIMNQRIALCQKSNQYLRVRFEDLFAGGEGSSAQLNGIREFIGQPTLSVEQNLEWLNTPVNASRSRNEPLFDEVDYREFIAKRLGREMEEFGYESC